MFLIRTGQYPLVRITTEKTAQISQTEWKALTLYTEHCNVKKEIFLTDECNPPLRLKRAL